MTIADGIEALVTGSPGLTKAEIAAALFGGAGYPERVSPACVRLIRERRIERIGRGERSDPFRYFPRGVLAVPNTRMRRRRYTV